MKYQSNYLLASSGSMRTLRMSLLAVALVASAASVAATKDVVLDQVTAPMLQTAPMAATSNSESMVVSVLVASPNGTMTPRSTQEVFRTGERIHLKVLSSRAGDIEIYNTNPVGQTSRVWSGTVRVGEETITPRMVLTGNRGEDQLHVVLTPQKPSGSVLDWLREVLSGKGKSVRKDVVLDTQSTPTSTYVVNTAGQGLTTTVRVVHN
jgi:hypothetical protein